jgi:hypothetical protein
MQHVHGRSQISDVRNFPNLFTASSLTTDSFGILPEVLPPLGPVADQKRTHRVQDSAGSLRWLIA